MSGVPGERSVQKRWVVEHGRPGEQAAAGRQILVAVLMISRMMNNFSYGSGESFAQGEC
jgi:hypothetical protein